MSHYKLALEAGKWYNHKMGLEKRLLAAAAIGLMLTACNETPSTPAGLRPAESLPRPPVAGREFNPPPPIKETNTQIIKRAAKTIGVTEDPAEIQRWQTIVPLEVPVAPFEGDFMAAAVPYNETIRLMGLSSNPYFRQARQNIDELEQSGVLLVQLVSTLEDDQGKPLSSQTRIDNNNGKLIIVVSLDAAQVLNDGSLNPINLALKLIEIAEHAKKTAEEVKRVPFLDHLHEPDVLDYLSAHAAAALINAYIVAVGQGYEGGDGLKLEEAVIAFIEFGRNPNDPRWRAYLQKQSFQPTTTGSVTRL